MPASIDVVFTPDLLPFCDLTGKTVVVTDILRATTTITFAVANGATTITPVLTPEDAFRLAADQPNTLIGGERGGVKVNGFDLGNSPREYVETVVSDRQIVLTTTNGTRTLQACRAAEHILVGSFFNLSAIVDQLAQVEGELVIACSGREGGFCTEDTAFAGACVAALGETLLTDAAETAKILYQTHCEDLPGMLKNCYHGRSLARIGLGEDLEFCAQVDIVDVLPHLVDGQITA
jgi:2-phosphosulfolactate phosphatase